MTIHLGFFQSLIRIARAQHASDLHVIAGLPPAIRVNGEIVMLEADTLGREEVSDLVLGILNEMQREELQRKRELCFSLFDADSGRMRVTVYYHAGVPELSVRLCALQISDIEELGLPSILNEWARKPNGLLLFTGPTGVGKTTTLNYMVDVINRERRAKIVMIEDPVEYVHKPIRSLIVQQEVHTDTLSFSNALVHVLRQNPDVIVVGEMRDQETIQTALTAAETGHLVMATLHTPNVMQTMERIIGVFAHDMQQQISLQLASSLQGVVTQSLIPKADGSGRVLACEVLVPTAAVRNYIREHDFHKIENALTTGRKEGMITMDACLQDLYQRAVITYDAAVARARDPLHIRGR